MLEVHALPVEGNADAVALTAPGRAALTYAGLHHLLHATAGRMARLGVRPGERVVLVTPNGPEAATAFLAVGAVGVAAPLNPRYTRAEADFCVEDLAPAAVVVDRRLPDAPVRAAAAARGVPVIDLVPSLEDRAGTFALDGDDVAPDAAALPARGPDDVALVLHTSGTTSRPKAVPLTHANLAASARAVGRVLRLAPGDRCLNVMPLFHIHGLVAALLASLAAGGSVSCAAALDPDAFLDWLTAEDATWYTAVPTMHQAILGAAARRAGWSPPPALRLIRSSSAALAPSVLADVEARFGVPVLEAYGMTEAAHQMASNPLPPGERRPGSVGVAAGPEVAIMGDGGRLLDAGEVGEVVVRGPNITAGYERNPDADADAFVDGWFRTGDQGALDADGYLTLTGRLKELINRGGEKVAPREVDEALLAHPAVAQAVAFAVPHPTLGEEVAAAVVPADPDHPPDAVALRAFAAERLAAFKVPRRIVVVDEIPKGPTGKLQRIGLAAALGIAGAAPSKGGAGADTPALTGAVAGVWSHVLGRAVGPDDDFFLLGGDSLTALQLVAAVHEVFGVELSPGAVVDDASSPSAMAAAIAAARRLAPAGRQDGPARRTGAGPHPLSPAQEAVWFAERLAAGRPANNTVQVLRLRGPLDVEALRAALDDLVARHDALRTTFDLADGGPVQWVGPPAPVALAIDTATDPGDADARMRALASEPFDLGAGPLLRATLLRTGEDEHVLVLVVHHLVIDGWSRRVVRRDLLALYGARVGGGPAALPPGPLQLADVAAWQRDRARGEPGRRDLAVWQQRFPDVPEAADLLADRPQQAAPSYEGTLAETVLPPELVDRLRTLARAERTTLFGVLLAGIVALLHRSTGRTDVVVTTRLAGRHLAGLDDVVGLLSPALPLRIDASGEPTFAALVRRAATVLAEAQAHPDVPLDELLHGAAAPLFTTLFQLRTFPADLPTAGGLAVDELVVDSGIAPLDFVFDIEDVDGALRCAMQYATELFDRDTVDRVLHRYRALLAAAVDDPSSPVSRLALLTGDELARIESWQGAVVPPSAPTLVALFERQCECTPDALALVGAPTGHALTYAEVDASANRLAHHLRRRGIGAGDLVGVLVNRTPAMVTAILGVLKAGAAYVPVDAHQPPVRIEELLADAGVALVVTDDALAPLAGDRPSVRVDGDAAALAAEPATRPADPPGPGDLAYVIYTSGSTGKPKGVLLEHRNAVNVVDWGRATFSAEELALVAGVTPLGFDVSVSELLTPLATGGAVLVLENALSLVEPGVADGVTLVNTVPSALVELLRAGALPSTLRTIVLAGEALPAALVTSVRSLPSPPRLVNAYGPTETAVLVTAKDVTEDTGRAPTIGRAVPNVRLRVLDPSGQQVPVGVPGELCVGGPVVARGYLDRPELTAERFVPDPFAPPGRLYRTGDRVRWRADGELEYLGRFDHQLKVRGVRVEPGEIDAVLEAHPSVVRALTVGRATGRGDVRIDAYVECGAGAARPRADELRAHVAARLPVHLVPATYTVLDRLPLTSAGKADRAALPAPAEGNAGEGPVGGTILEEQLRVLFGTLLERTDVGVEDDFFELGGHSLLAVQLAVAIEERYGGGPPLAELVAGATPRMLAAAIGGAARAGASDVPVLFAVHAWAGAALAYRDLAAQLAPDVHVHPIVAQQVEPGREALLDLRELASRALADMRRLQPAGPYLLTGHSMGGLIAYEMACRLVAEGERVALLVLLDATAPLAKSLRGRVLRAARRSGRRNLAGLRAHARLARGHLPGGAKDAETPPPGVVEQYDEVGPANRLARQTYRAPAYAGDVLVVATAGWLERTGSPTLGWDALVHGRVTTVEAEGEHLTVLLDRNIAPVAARIRAAVHAAAGPGQVGR